MDAPIEHVIRLATASAAYDITIGENLLATLSARLDRLPGVRTSRVFVVTSPEIWRLWSEPFLASFSGRQPVILMLPAGEQHKRLQAVETLAEQMAQHGADRDALLIAFGGGVIGDITGFLAAIYMRGIPYVQVPTTFLAQVDSSVGGKTGVNLAAGKNLIGSFHQPLAVFADPALLTTLPEAEFLAGIQESVKAAIIQSDSLFLELEQNEQLARKMNLVLMLSVLRQSIQIKADIVMSDERESGARMLLNFGHTLGHAFEAATQYRSLLHGQAVAYGMLAAIHVALGRGLVSEAEAVRMRELILAFGSLPPVEVDPAHLVALTAADKKNRSGRRAFILPTAIGAAQVFYDVTDAELLAAAEAVLELAPSTAVNRI